jgi:hypothetical protein
MRVFSYFVFLVGVGLLLPIASAGEFKLEPGFKLIFNGKNFDGWQPKGKKDALEGKTDIGRFKVIDGGIVRFDSSKKGESYIETAKELPGDVVVKFDFKPGPKCNNDFFLRGIKFDIVPGNKECKNVKEGEWHTLEIIAKGDTVEHRINGELSRTSKKKSEPSRFIMRAEIGVIDVKNIRVKE